MTSRPRRHPSAWTYSWTARAWAGVVAAGVIGCAAPPSHRPLSPAGRAEPDGDESRKAVAAFADVERDAIDWLAAADPRLALRAGVVASDAVLRRVGMDAVLAEDATAQIRGGSLDLFAFRARAAAIEQASNLVDGFARPLPLAAPDAVLARPRLERELLARLIDEERLRGADESRIAEAAGDLVRGILATWSAPSAPQEWADRDAWLSRHLLEIRDAVRDGWPRSGPLDVDVALYPLERLLAPLQFPRGAAAIAEVRVAIDSDPRVPPALVSRDRLVRTVQAHLGVALDPSTLGPRVDRLEAILRDRSLAALAASGPARAQLLSRAKELLLVERRCPPVAGSRVRSMAPPPERAAVCGALAALAANDPPGAATVALHDDILLALAATMTAPPPRTRLISGPEDDVVDALERDARERPAVALGVVLAAEILFAASAPDERLARWVALGDVPLDVATRELDAR